MATEQGSKAVEAGVKQAAQAGEAIRILAETSDEAVQAAIQIVSSSKQQVVGMDQIGIAMENINQAGSQNAASMKQMEIAAQNLHELGEKLKEWIKKSRNFSSDCGKPSALRRKNIFAAFQRDSLN
jgi:methyl-accepting chemotaxis protein